MKTLLRSCFVAASNDDRDILIRNFLDLNMSGLGFEVLEDSIIWEYIKAFVLAHNHVPEISTLRQHYSNIGEDTVLDRLDELDVIPSRTWGDFRVHLEARAEDLRKRKTLELLKEAVTITGTGMEIQEGRERILIRGPIKALQYLQAHSHDIVAPTLGPRLSGEVTTDGADFQTEYERVEADPLAGIGQHSGLKQMDVALNGAKRYELWIHAAFTGGLKSTLMLNWAYNQAVWLKHTNLIFSLEMPYHQCRRILYAMHSMHSKFQKTRYDMGLQKDRNACIGLPYENMRDGTLGEWHENAREFLFDHVIKDFNDAKNNYGNIHIEVPDPDKSDFTVSDMRTKAELIYAESPFSLLFIDHLGLMAPRKWVSNTTDRLNEVIRDTKRLAMSFNRGHGMAIVGLFQISREGMKAAMKRKDAGGVPGYNLTHLSYANEAERSSDIVTATWIDDDLREKNRAQFQCLKSRDQKPFEMFLARVEWACRRLITCYDIPLASKKESAGDELEEADAALDEL